MIRNERSTSTNHIIEWQQARIEALQRKLKKKTDQAMRIIRQLRNEKK
jgi:hypothetical protein